MSARCSAKGCGADAAFAVVWNNPKLHTPDREKRWLACDAHRQHLADFLDARGFLLRVEPLPDVAALPEVDPTPPQVPGRTAPA